jgi:hypothetical protein
LLVLCNWIVCMWCFMAAWVRCSLGTAYRASLVGLLLVSSNKL